MSLQPSSDGRIDTSFGEPSGPSLGREKRPLGVPDRLTYPNIPVCGLLERTARATPERIASHFLGHEMNYGQIWDASLALAGWLQSRDIHSGARVGLLLPNCPEYWIALNAVWRAGAVAVAISPLSSPQEIGRLMKHTDCRHVVTLDMLRPLLQQSQVLTEIEVSLDRYLNRWKTALYHFARWRKLSGVQAPKQHVFFWEAVDSSPNSPTPIEVLPDRDPAYILSTGGTTGDPKAVTLSHRNIVANAWQQMHWLRGSQTGSTRSSSNSVSLHLSNELPSGSVVDQQETMLAALPFFHSYGMSTMLATGACIGAKVVMLPRFSPKQTLAAIREQRPTIFHAVPAMLAALNARLKKRRYDLSSIRWVISGGASLPLQIARQFQEHSGAIVVEGYGLSESSPVTHVGPLDGSNQAGTIGMPLPDTDCRIVDLDQGTQNVAPGEVGELLIRGPQVMLGYWENPTATKQVLHNGWLRTGDLVRRNQQGFYQIVDRKKDLIITSGFNVYPTDVEQALQECVDIRDAAVVGVPDPIRGEIVKAFVVLQPGVRWNPSKLDRFCRSRLAKHRQPKLWERVHGDLPRNFLGKIIRRELR